MKKIAIILAALLLVLSVCACTDNGNEGNTQGPGGVIINPGDTGSEGNTTSGEEETTKPEQSAGNYTFEDRNDKVYIISMNGAANLRNDTTTADSSKEMSLKNGVELDRKSETTDGEWSKVTYEGKDYYIKSSLITTMQDPDEGFTPVEKTLVAAGNFYVRIIPDTKNDAVGTISKGDEVKVVAEKEGWYKIQFKNAYFDGEYYVSSDASLYESEDTTTAAE